MEQNVVKLPNGTAVSPEFVRLVELEATQTMEGFRWLATQLVQVATVLSVASLTAMGYALTNKQAGLFLLGVGFTTILLFAYRAGFLGAVPLLCRLIALENLGRLVLDETFETGISLALLNILGPEFLDEANKINKLIDRSEKRSAMRKLETKLFTRRATGFGTMVVVFAILIQIAIIPILILEFGWNFI